MLQAMGPFLLHLKCLPSSLTALPSPLPLLPPKQSVLVLTTRTYSHLPPVSSPAGSICRSLEVINNSPKVPFSSSRMKNACGDFLPIDCHSKSTTPVFTPIYIPSPPQVGRLRHKPFREHTHEFVRSPTSGRALPHLKVPTLCPLVLPIKVALR
jgi:hypothetical protein